ncbi:MAG: DJ-1/PfpI family protein [Clostridiales bacterium]|nr:DJ-1/PfpI family protein [Clostridiales bacterium]
MKTIVFLADGFEECEALIVVDILRRARIEVDMASVMGRRVVLSSRKIPVTADVLAEDVDFSDVDMIILPGGRAGTENLKKSPIVLEKCVEFEKEKHIAAICAAPTIFAELGLLAGKKATCHPDFADQLPEGVGTGESVVVCGNIITGQALGATFEFAFEIVRMLVGEEPIRKIKKAICY